jgi:hypothetical protein
MQFQSQGGIQPGTAAVMDGHVNAHSLVRSSTSGINAQSGYPLEPQHMHRPKWRRRDRWAAARLASDQAA